LAKEAEQLLNNKLEMSKEPVLYKYVNDKLIAPLNFHNIKSNSFTNSQLITSERNIQNQFTSTESYNNLVTKDNSYKNLPTKDLLISNSASSLGSLSKYKEYFTNKQKE